MIVGTLRRWRCTAQHEHRTAIDMTAYRMKAFIAGFRPCVVGMVRGHVYNETSCVSADRAGPRINDFWLPELFTSGSKPNSRSSDQIAEAATMSLRPPRTRRECSRGGRGKSDLAQLRTIVWL